MPIDGLTTYLPTMAEVLAHWLAVNVELGGTVATDLKLQGGFTRAMFQTLYDDLDSLIQGLVDFENAREIGGASRDQTKKTLLERLAQFRGMLRGLLSHTIYPGAAPLVPTFGLSEGKFLTPFDDMASLWGRINADATIAGFTPPLLLPGLTQAQFVTALADLRAAYAAMVVAENDELIGRKRRDALLPQIRERIVQYRELVAAMLGANHPLTLSLPALTPNPGSTPTASVLAGAWNIATSQADLSWTPSDDPNLEEYEVRMSPGASYDAANATVVANLPPGSTALETTAGLANPGDVASFKVFVKLTTGNVAGSNTVTITRP